MVMAKRIVIQIPKDLRITSELQNLGIFQKRLIATTWMIRKEITPYTCRKNWLPHKFVSKGAL